MLQMSKTCIRNQSVKRLLFEMKETINLFTPIDLIFNYFRDISHFSSSLHKNGNQAFHTLYQYIDIVIIYITDEKFKITNFLKIINKMF